MKKTRLKKWFISGKVSGLCYSQACYNFASAEVFIYTTGAIPVNPMRLCNPAWSWLLCMVVCLWHLSFCRGIYMQRNWRESRGARIERRFAQLLGKLEFYEP